MARNNNILSQIRWYDISQAKASGDTAVFIKFAKRAAKLVNNRLYKLEKAGLSSRATTGGVKHIDLASIKDKQSAARAISKAKSVVANPLSTVGSVRKQFKAAQAEYGKSGRMKFIAEEVPVLDSQGKPTGKFKLVPKAVPWGTNVGAQSWTDARQAIKSFWTWYQQVGNAFFSSNDAYDIWEESGYNSDIAKKEAEKYLQRSSEAGWQEYKDQMTQLYGFSSWID